MGIKQRDDENLGGSRTLSRMLRIPWTDKVSTCEVLRRTGVWKGLMQDMIRR